MGDISFNFERFGFIGTMPIVGPWLLFLALEGSPLQWNSLWKAGYGTTAVRMNSTIETPSGTIHLGDPVISPNGSEIVYVRIPLSGSTRTLRKVNWDDTSNVQIQSETNSTHFSLQPCWHPDGSKIIYKLVTSTGSEIKRINADGSGDTTLYSSSSTGLRGITSPTYSYDGTKIAFVEDYTIRTINADGSGLVIVFDNGFDAWAITAPAWARNSNVIAWYASDDNTFNSNRKWYKGNADGSGVTMLVNDGVAGSSTGIFASYDKNIWLPDDSGFVAVRWIDLATDKYVVRIVSSAGGAADISPERNIRTNSRDYQPLVLETPQNEWRIFFPESSGSTIIASVALDGSDYRVEFDPTSFSPQPIFHGFEGDTIN